MRESPRTRRLRNDRKALEKLRGESTILHFECQGQPANQYVLYFHGHGLWRPNGSQNVLVRESHEVRVVLGAAYPRMMPELNWISPVFHPNISASGVVCLGGYGTHWVPSLSLDALCVMLWDMVRYRNFDVDSPYNREAAIWTRTQTTYRLPVDARPLRDRVACAGDGSPVYHARPPQRVRIDHAQCVRTPEVLILDDAQAEVIDAEVIESEGEDIVYLD